MNILFLFSRYATSASRTLARRIGTFPVDAGAQSGAEGGVDVRNAATTTLHYPVTAHNINLHETFG
jgi:hypothetical protein